MTHRLAFPLLLLAVSAGCATTRSDPASGILVRDAETGAPVPGAAVRVSNFIPTAGTRVPNTAAAAGADGVAWVRIPATENASGIVTVTAPGYLSTVTHLRDTGPGADPGVRLAAEVFAGPRPTVELVLPKDYRGPVRLEVNAPDGRPDAPGRRKFRYDVPASGVVTAEGSPVLRLLLNPDVRAVYDDGSELARDGHDFDVAFRWVRSDGGGHDFMVGTKTECLALRRQASR